MHFDAKINNRNHIKAFQREFIQLYSYTSILPLDLTTIINLKTY